MNIDEMKAGRELDALVAEKVMGWTDARVGIRSQRRFHREELPTPVDVGPDEEWSPSTDIAAAWEVVAKFQMVYVYRAAKDLPNLKIGQWEALFSPDAGERALYGVADTAPLAICKAALKTVGYPE